MKPKILLRIAAVLLVLFAMGHSTGHYGRKNTTDPAGQAVIKAMEDYHFEFKGRVQTIDGHLEGYGWLLTCVLVSVALSLWFISSSYKQAPNLSAKILCALLIFIVGNAYIAFKYFFLGPGIFSVTIGLLLIVSALMITREQTA